MPIAVKEQKGEAADERLGEARGSLPGLISSRKPIRGPDREPKRTGVEYEARLIW